MKKFYWYICKLFSILFAINLLFPPLYRVSGIIFTIIIIIVYSFLEIRSFLKNLRLNTDTTNNVLSTVVIKSLDYSLKRFGYALFYSFFITYFISILGARHIPVYEFGHFFEPKEYNAKYLVQYKFDEKSLNPKLGTAEIFRESNWNGHSFYYITKIFDENDIFEFDNICTVKTFKNWYFCDELTTNNDTIWIFITDTKIE